MPRIVTISGETAVGTTSIAKELQKLLGWERVNVGDWFRTYSLNLKLNVNETSKLPDQTHEEFDSRQRQLLVTSEKLILEGRLSGWLAHEIDGVYRVWCYASEEIRVKRYGIREQLEYNDALQTLRQRDMSDLLKYRAIYNLHDYRNGAYYNLILDTSNASPLQLARRVCKYSKLL